VVLVLRPEDQPQLTRMRHRDPRGDRTEQVVVVAVAAAGLVADLEAIGQALEDPHHLVDGPHLGAAGDWPGLAEHADRDALAVDIEPDVEHGCLLNSVYPGTAATQFHVTRLTGASFIVSTPTHFPNADPEAQESHDRIWTSDHNKPSIVVSSCYRKITSRRSRPLLHAVRRRASKEERQIAGNLTAEGVAQYGLERFTDWVAHAREVTRNPHNPPF